MNEEPTFEVTKKLVEESVTQEIYVQAAFKTCICILVLNSGTECVGSYSQPVVSDENPVDIAEGKKKAKKAAMREAYKAVSSVNEWRKAVYLSQKAQAEAQAKAQEEVQNTPTSAPVQ